MLRLRGAFDPKRFYKSIDNSKFPKYFQMGTVVEGPTDFYSGAPSGFRVQAAVRLRPGAGWRTARLPFGTVWSRPC